MAHFGIICPPATGHLNPMTALGYELKKRGHRVTLFGILDVEAKASAAGIEFRVIGEEEFPIGAMAESLTQLGKLNGLAALKYTLDLFEKGETMVLERRGTIASENLDALLVDQTSPAGGTIAELLGIPFVTVCSALMVNRDEGVPPFNTSWQYNPAWWAVLRNRAGYALLDRVGKSFRDAIGKYRQEWKLPLHSSYNDSFSQLAQISQQPAEFEFPRQHLPECFHFTGPYHNQASREPTFFPWEQLNDKPLIYASMGTLQNRLMGVFAQIASACAGLDAQLVISLGGSAEPESLPNLPGNPLVVKYAPQLELLQRTTLTITHAGLNTTLESLSNGVPMVAIPVANDQPGVSSRIAWTGTGEVVTLKSLTVSRLRKAIQKVLQEDSYQQNALRLQQAIDRSGGVQRAADIIEQVVSTGKAVLSSS